MDGEGPFDDLEGNAAFGRLFKKFLDKNVVTGLATLVAGTVTVSTSAVEADSVITLTPRGNTNAGSLDIQTITAGTSFVIRSSNASDVRVVGWSISKSTT